MIPTREELHQIGQVTRLHGYRGELTIYLDTTSLDDYRDLDFLFIDLRGTIIPFRVAAFEPKGKNVVKVKLDNVNSEEEAKRLVKGQVFIRKEKISEGDEARIELRSIGGYTVIDHERGKIGVVKSVMEIQTNPQLEIDADGKTVLLPLREEFISGINPKKKEVHITPPPGLLEMYLD